MLLLVYRELIKISRLKILWVLLAILLCFQLYAYINVANTFTKILPTVSGIMEWTSDQDMIEFLKNAPLSDPLKMHANILGTSMVITYNLSILNIFGPFLSVILAAKIVGNEYLYKTIQILWTEGASRTNLIVSKFIAITITLLIVILTTCIVGLLLSISVRLLYDIPVIQPFAWTQWVKNTGTQLVVTVLGLILWSSLAFLVTILTRSSLAGIITGIGYPIAETYIASSINGISNFFPLWNQKATSSASFKNLDGGIVGFPDVSQVPSFAISLSVTLIYLVFFILTTFFVWNRQEFK